MIRLPRLRPLRLFAARKNAARPLVRESAVRPGHDRLETVDAVRRTDRRPGQVDAAFIAKAEAAAGMTWAEIEWWASRIEFEQQQYARDLGHCCWAGATAAPKACPWHGEPA